MTITWTCFFRIFSPIYIMLYIFRFFNSFRLNFYMLSILCKLQLYNFFLVESANGKSWLCYQFVFWRFATCHSRKNERNKLHAHTIAHYFSIKMAYQHKRVAILIEASPNPDRNCKDEPEARSNSKHLARARNLILFCLKTVRNSNWYFYSIDSLISLSENFLWRFYLSASGRPPPNM